MAGIKIDAQGGAAMKKIAALILAAMFAAVSFQAVAQDKPKDAKKDGKTQADSKKKDDKSKK